MGTPYTLQPPRSAIPVPAGNAIPVSSRLVGLLRAVAARMVDAHERDLARGRLEQMSDRELRDIGLCRHDIPRVVRTDYHDSTVVERW